MHVGLVFTTVKLVFMIITTAQSVVPTTVITKPKVTDKHCDARAEHDSEKGWKAFNTSCYKVFTEYEYFTTASKMCKSQKGDLVSILSEKENEHVREMVANKSEFKEAWIGFRKKQNTWADLQYENWLIGKPDDQGSCVEIIPGGKWANILCYNQMQFVCKRAPPPPHNNGNLGMILNVSIPVSCVIIMLVFVAFLCIRSVKELEAMKSNTREAKPFELIQAAMVLPIAKAPDLLLSSKGKKLWQGAIERIKKEQLQNNPLNSPSTFLQRVKQLNGSKEHNIENDRKLSSSFPQLVQTLMRERAETMTNGLLGAPISAPSNIPVISIASSSLDEETRLSWQDNNVSLDGESISSNLDNDSASSPASSPSSSKSLQHKNKSQRTDSVKLNAGPNEILNIDHKPSYKSNVDLWLKKSPATRRKELRSDSFRRKQEFILGEKNAPVVLDDFNCENVNKSYGDTNVRNADDGDKQNNLVEVVVDINRQAKNEEARVNLEDDEEARVNSEDDEETQVKMGDKQLIMPSGYEETGATSNLTRSSEKKENISKQRHTIKNNNSHNDPNDDFAEQDTKRFSDVLRQECFWRKETYFPSANFDNLQMREGDIPLTRHKIVNDKFVKITLV